MPLVIRRVMAYVLELTSACTSTRIGRDPSIEHNTADLADAARRRLKLQREDRLHRVDDDERGLEACDLFENPLQACFGKQVERRRADREPLAARLDLVFGLLAGGVEHRAEG